MIHSDLGCVGGEPVIAAALLAGAAIYALGSSRIAARSHRRRRVWRGAIAFAVGWCVLAGALASPLRTEGLSSFPAHMVQHELLMVIAAPLIVLGRPVRIMLWACPHSSRRAIGRVLNWRSLRAARRFASNVIIACFVQAIVIWVWHVPVFFEAALHGELLHAVQHVAFTGSALLFWESVLYPAREAAVGAGLLSLFATAAHTGALGGLMTMSRAPWYSTYAHAPSASSNPLQDQQVAGLIMWIPPNVLYLIAGLLLARRWLGRSTLEMSYDLFEQHDGDWARNPAQHLSRTAASAGKR